MICSRVGWTALQHRATALLIARLEPGEEDFEMQHFHVDELVSPGFEEDLDIRPDDVCNQLLNQTIHTGCRGDEKNREHVCCNCFSTCRYDLFSGEVEAKFSSDMKPFLLEPEKTFVTYRLEEFMRLTSRHSMRVYELINAEEALGGLVFSVDQFCRLIGGGEDCESLEELEATVLEPSQAEIKDRCDLYYTYSVEREEEARGKIRFAVHHRIEAGEESSSQSSSNRDICR